MSYWGKVVGAVAGLATGRPWMAIVGLILGHQFDRGFSDRFRKFGADASSGKLEQLSVRFVQGLFQTMGHLAKLDGRVTENEIRAARALMHRLGLGPAEIRRAIDWFESGKPQDFPAMQLIRQINSEGLLRGDSGTLFVQLLMEVALSKSTLHERERALLWSICMEAGIGRVEFAQLEAMLRAQRGFRRSPHGDVDSDRVAAAYRALGVDMSASNADIKKSYRRLMNKNHPDKIAPGNPEKSVVVEAERRTREVRAAYELLKSRRSIR